MYPLIRVFSAESIYIEKVEIFQDEVPQPHCSPHCSMPAYSSEIYTISSNYNIKKSKS